jgi:hypothetical protein
MNASRGGYVSGCQRPRTAPGAAPRAPGALRRCQRPRLRSRVGRGGRGRGCPDAAGSGWPTAARQRCRRALRPISGGNSLTASSTAVVTNAASGWFSARSRAVSRSTGANRWPVPRPAQRLQRAAVTLFAPLADQRRVQPSRRSNAPLPSRSSAAYGQNRQLGPHRIRPPMRPLGHLRIRHLPHGPSVRQRSHRRGDGHPTSPSPALTTRQFLPDEVSHERLAEMEVTGSGTRTVKAARGSLTRTRIPGELTGPSLLDMNPDGTPATHSPGIG